MEPIWFNSSVSTSNPNVYLWTLKKPNAYLWTLHNQHSPTENRELNIGHNYIFIYHLNMGIGVLILDIIVVKTWIISWINYLFIYLYRV